MKEMNNVEFFRKNGFFKYPYFLQIEITDCCPLGCSQCYKKKSDFNFLSYEKFKQIIDEAKILNVKKIFFNGGEPLVHREFIKMVYYCQLSKIQSAVITSGYGIDEVLCKQLKNTDLQVLISLNASNKQLNEKSRDGFDYAVNSMDILQKNSIPFRINWVARHDNIDDLPQLIDLVKGYGASSINIVCNKISGNGKLDSAMTLEDYIKLKNIINSYYSFCSIQPCYGILLSLLGKPNNNLYGCQAGISLMAMSVKGEFMPCTHLYYKENFSSLLDYWEKSDVLRKLREVKDLKYCKDCNKCRVCHSISSYAHNDFSVGFKECPLKVGV